MMSNQGNLGPVPMMSLLGALSAVATACILYFVASRRAKTKATKSGLHPAGWRERRRNNRQILEGTVGIYGRGLAGQPFYDEARIVDVSESGGRLQLSAPVHTGQELLVINDARPGENIGRVVRVRIDDNKTFEVAVEFLNPLPEFWQRVDRSLPRA
jgi:hypothetical protein